MSNRPTGGPALRINIVGLDNGAGLSVDARLLEDLLQDAGFRARWFRGVRPAKWLTRLARLPVLGRLMRRHDMNLFLERIHPGWYPFAKLNALIPNPEWFRDELLGHLGGVDRVLCKTVDAQRAFESLGKLTSWIGFTAEDRGGPSLAAANAQVKALHVAGRSEHKGTRAVIDAWGRNSHWPVLTVVQRVLNPGTVLYAPALPNVRYFSERLSDDELLALQRDHAIYILPSEVEGYGQALVEGMSLGAIVITTDAPPMNELVAPERGLLVQAIAGQPLHLGRRYEVVGSALEDAVEQVLGWSPERRSQVGVAAREWYIENDRRFRADFPRLIASLLS